MANMRFASKVDRGMDAVTAWSNETSEKLRQEWNEARERNRAKQMQSQSQSQTGNRDKGKGKEKAVEMEVRGASSMPNMRFASAVESGVQEDPAPGSDTQYKSSSSLDRFMEAVIKGVDSLGDTLIEGLNRLKVEWEQAKAKHEKERKERAARPPKERSTRSRGIGGGTGGSHYYGGTGFIPAFTGTTSAGCAATSGGGGFSAGCASGGGCGGCGGGGGGC